MQHVSQTAKDVGMPDLDDRRGRRRTRTFGARCTRCAQRWLRPARVAFDDAAPAQRRMVRDRRDEIVETVRCEDQLDRRRQRPEQRENVAPRAAVEPVRE